jgi:hypothetical protein
MNPGKDCGRPTKEDGNKTRNEKHYIPQWDIPAPVAQFN